VKGGRLEGSHRGEPLILDLRWTRMLLKGKMISDTRSQGLRASAGWRSYIKKEKTGYKWVKGRSADAVLGVTMKPLLGEPDALREVSKRD